MIGFIGGGNMAEALLKGMIQDSRFKIQDIFVSEPIEERRKYLEEFYRVRTTNSNKEVASSCSIIILAVKPQNIATVLDEIEGAITDDKTVVSIAAGIKFSYLSLRLKTERIVRVMPNTPVIIQEGMSVISLCECISDKDMGIVREIFMSVGKVITLPEKYMNAVTALSGSGPAFIAFFIEAMVEGGVNMGLQRDDALTLAVQTSLGASKLLDGGMSPLKLRETVTSPGGTTAEGLRVFENRGLKGIVVDAIEAATKRAEELGKTVDSKQ